VVTDAGTYYMITVDSIYSTSPLSISLLESEGMLICEGNILFSDCQFHVIRCHTPTGNVKIIAGKLGVVEYSDNPNSL